MASKVTFVQNIYTFETIVRRREKLETRYANQNDANGLDHFGEKNLICDGW
jgi:hypothetical protein